MPTAFSHPAAALALRLGAGGGVVSRRLLALAVACTVLPDLDVVGLWLGIPYGHPLGHRGFTHSPFFALLVAWIASRRAETLRASPAAVFVVVALSTASHGVLDAMTYGARGVAFLSPFSNERILFPWRPILASPIGIVRFFQPRSWAVLGSEIVWIWLPLGALGLAAAILRRAITSRSR